MRAAVATSPREDPVPALAVLRLGLRDFRNYPRLGLDTGGDPVVLHGPNGAGKTNLLEAISLLAPGRGLRGARLPELDRRGGGPFAVEARVQGHAGPAEIRIVHDAAAERREVRLDGHPLRGSAALGETLSLIWLTPAMDRLFVEASGERRRFLDRLVLAVDPAHGRRVALYERSLRERGALLRAGRADPAWLAALERRIAETGVAIAAARRELLAGLERVLTAERLPFPRPRLQLLDELAAALDAAPAVEVERRFAARLAVGRAEDALTGGAAVGPHRADLEAVDRATGEPARLASTGRQKAWLVAILLAEAALCRRLKGDVPILLLDEIAAHLDPGRRQDLFAVLVELGCRFWLTGTERALFASLAGRARILHVQDATVSADD